MLSKEASEKIKRDIANAKAADLDRDADVLAAAGSHARAVILRAKAAKYRNGEIGHKVDKDGQDHFNAMMGIEKIKPVAMGLTVCGQGIAIFFQRLQAAVVRSTAALPPDEARAAAMELWATARDLFSDEPNIDVAPLDPTVAKS
jgi:hypothetical protein